MVQEFGHVGPGNVMSHDMAMLNQGSWRCSPGHRQKRPRWVAHSLVHSGGMWAAGSAVWMLAAVPQTKNQCSCVANWRCFVDSTLFGI